MEIDAHTLCVSEANTSRMKKMSMAPGTQLHKIKVLPTKGFSFIFLKASILATPFIDN